MDWLCNIYNAVRVIWTIQMNYCCPLCSSMEEFYLVRVALDHDEPVDCEVLEADDDE